MRPPVRNTLFAVLLGLLAVNIACSGLSTGGSSGPGNPTSLTISNASLAGGQVGVPYSATVAATGGTSPYTWNISEGQRPPGLTLGASSGVLAGTPTQPGQFSFTLLVTDASVPQQTASQSVQLTISSVQITTNSLPVGVLQQAYNGRLRAGTGSYTWNAGAGQLPSGLTLNSETGQISGTPTQSGTFPVIFTAKDSSGFAGSKNLNIQVYADLLDSYGGLTNAVSPAGATGYFRVEKSGPRWLLVTPEGHYTWMRAVDAINGGAAGAAYQNAIASKYGNTLNWARQTAFRMQNWGFNSIGEYASYKVLPVNTGQSPANPVQMPYIRLLQTSATAMAAPNHVKDIVYGTNPTYYTGLQQPFPDVYDSSFKTIATQVAANSANTPSLSTNPWIIGNSMDDADYLLGFKSSSVAHPAWITAVTAPTQTSNSQQGVTYTDTTVHTKLAWSNFLANKYGTIGVLNAAWGSNYSTFGSNGGWGKGTGLLDEDGRNVAWIGQDYAGLSDTNVNTARDMNEFLENGIAETYFSIQANAIHAATPHHMVFSPDMLWVDARPQVLRAVGRHCDAAQLYLPLNLSHSAAQLAAELTAAYEQIAGQGTSCTNCKAIPVYVYFFMTATPDSPFAVDVTPPIAPSTDFPTQQDRGEMYSAALPALFAGQASDGTYPLIGITWWAWNDADVPRALQNWGLVTSLDNAYDGQEAVVAAGNDPWGFSTGGELQNYGDFVTYVQTANWTVQEALRSLF